MAYASRKASCRSGPAWLIDKVPKRVRNVVTIDIAATLDFEGDIS